MEQVRVPDYKAKICAAFAQGNVGKAVKLASSENFDEMKNHVIDLLQNILYIFINSIKEFDTRIVIM